MGMTVDIRGAEASVPVEIRGRLEQEILRALAEPDLRAKLTAAGMDLVALPAARMAEVMRTETAYNTVVIKRLGYKPE